MRSLLFFFWLSVILPLSACAEEPAATLQGTVTWVYDGDTLKIDPIGKIRLIGIDSPERESSKRDSYLVRQGVSPGKQREIYHLAKEFNINQVKGRLVTLTLDKQPRDRHGRLLAYLHLADGRLLNRVLIEQGLAVVYRRFSFRLKDDFLAAEAEAVRNKRGLWE